MPLSDLLAALERDAGAQKDALLDAARADAERVTSATEARLALRRSAARAVTEAARRGELERDLARARRAARAQVLEAQAQLLGRVDQAVRRLLPEAVTRDEYRPTFVAALREALSDVGDSPVEIRCSPSLTSAVRDLVRARPGTSVASDPTVGSGFRVDTTDGRVEIDGTLEARYARDRAPLMLAALGWLEAAS